MLHFDTYTQEGEECEDWEEVCEQLGIEIGLVE